LTRGLADLAANDPPSQLAAGNLFNPTVRHAESAVPAGDVGHEAVIVAGRGGERRRKLEESKACHASGFASRRGQCDQAAGRAADEEELLASSL
jgi:hypothetical protein